MSNSFSFVHAADLHIASPFVGLTAQGAAIADRLRSSTFEAFDALVALGYKPNEVNSLLGKLDIEDLSAEDIIRLALKQAAA